MILEWKLESLEQMQLVVKIARRAIKLGDVYTFLDIQMDLTACHLNGNPLDFERLLLSEDIDFNHDICGIHVNINRDTGKLSNCFLPRYSKK
jgi:hypothetical protein